MKDLDLLFAYILLRSRYPRHHYRPHRVRPGLRCFPNGTFSYHPNRKDGDDDRVPDPCVRGGGDVLGSLRPADAIVACDDVAVVGGVPGRRFRTGRIPARDRRNFGGRGVLARVLLGGDNDRGALWKNNAGLRWKGRLPRPPQLQRHQPLVLRRSLKEWLQGLWGQLLRVQGVGGR